MLLHSLVNTWLLQSWLLLVRILLQRIRYLIDYQSLCDPLAGFHRLPDRHMHGVLSASDTSCYC